MEPYLTFDVISVRYKDKGTSLMTSQWRFRPSAAFLTATVRPSNTAFIRWFRPDQCDSWDFKAVETFQNVTNIVWAWDKFVTPCLLPRIRELIHTQHRNTTRGRRPSVVLRCCVWINSRIRISKQGVTNSNLHMDNVNGKCIEQTEARIHDETFSALLALCEGIQGSSLYSPQGQWRGALVFS